MSNLKDKFRKFGEENFKKGNQAFDNYLDLKNYNLERLKLEKDNKDYLIDILPYIIETENHPNKSKGEEYYCLDLYVHTFIGANKGNYVCMKKTFGKPCAICDEFDRLKEKFEHEGFSREETWDRTKNLYFQRRNIYHVLYDGKSYILDLPYKTFESIWWEAIQKKAKRGIEITPFYLNEDGCTSIEFTVVPKGQFYDIINFDFPEIKNYNEKWVKNLVSLEKLLVIPEQEKLKNILQGNEEAEVEENDYVKDVIEKEEENKPIKKEKKIKSECPYDLKFIDDFDSYNNCDECMEKFSDTYQICKSKYEENN